MKVFDAILRVGRLVDAHLAIVAFLAVGTFALVVILMRFLCQAGWW